MLTKQKPTAMASAAAAAAATTTVEIQVELKRSRETRTAVLSAIAAVDVVSSKETMVDKERIPSHRRQEKLKTDQHGTHWHQRETIVTPVMPFYGCCRDDCR